MIKFILSITPAIAIEKMGFYTRDIYWASNTMTSDRTVRHFYGNPGTNNN